MFLISSIGAAGAMMARWKPGARQQRLSLSFKGDIKRETRWLAQYGQSVCTPVAALLILQLDPRPWRTNPARRGACSCHDVTSIACTVIKRLLSRVRPGRENAGKFLGPNWKHDNYKESFPSSHSACAVTLSVLLAVLYPQAAITFWGLAVLCAGLR